MEPELIGIVRADISSMSFEEYGMSFEEHGRPTGYDQSIAQHLTKVFDGGRCDRDNPHHFLLGFISLRQQDLLL